MREQAAESGEQKRKRQIEKAIGRAIVEADDPIQVLERILDLYRPQFGSRGLLGLEVSITPEGAPGGRRERGQGGREIK